MWLIKTHNHEYHENIPSSGFSTADRKARAPSYGRSCAVDASTLRYTRLHRLSGPQLKMSKRESDEPQGGQAKRAAIGKPDHVANVLKTLADERGGKRLRFAVICSSNQNRSMEGHKFLAYVLMIPLL